MPPKESITRSPHPKLGLFKDRAEFNSLRSGILLSLDARSYLRWRNIPDPNQFPCPRTPGISAGFSISRLRAGSATFTLFPKLPLELRRKVWLAALFTPQVVSLHHVRRYNRSDARNELKFVPSAPRCRINQVCREARDEAMRVQFRLCPYLGGQPNFFFNYEADTIWLSNRALSEDEAESDTFGLDEYLDFGKKHVRLAIDEQFWHRIFQSGRNEDDYQWPFMHLTELGVEEVMVVIGDCEVVRHSGQIAITTPRGSPDDFGIVPLDRDVFETNPTWDNIGEQEIKRLRDFQAVRAEARQEMFDAALDPDVDSMRICDISDFTIKKISYVEAVTFEELDKLENMRRRHAAWLKQGLDL
ncbi:hypothetical protein DL95DRAFT_408622 [Leptodontidium sp. 2 PMI_412]|nr:hypothetical protein DL95DRAFT_408622 [Leptodontidium sp. 2 PMI_412]